MNLAPTGWVDLRRRPVGWDWPTGRRRTRLEGLLRNDPLYFRASALPTLDQNFAEDRSLVDRISGRQLISFSRSSTGTYIAQDGLLKTAAINEPRFDHDPVTGRCQGLLVEATRTNRQNYSTDFTNFLQTSGSNERWIDRVEVNVIPFANTDPAGTFNASKVIPTTNNTSHYLGRYMAYNNVTYRFSIFVKPAGYSAISVTFNIPSATFRLSGDGAILSDGGLGATIQRLSNNWYRIACSVTYIGGGANNFQPRITILNNSLQSTFSGDGVSGIEVFGFQVEVGPFATSYIPTPATFTSRASTATFNDANGIIQTVASGVARSNAWFPDSNGVMRPAGLLLESAATNLCTQSETFAGTPFTLEGVTAAKNEVDPAGGTNATRVTATAGSGNHRLREQISNTRVIRSFFLKKASSRYVYIADNNGGYYGPSYKIDLDLGVITLLRNGNLDAYPNYRFEIQRFPNGYFRVVFDALQTDIWALSSSNTNLSVGASVPVTFTADGTESFIIYGYQVETGSLATSYIRTTGSTVTRAADTATSSAVTRSADVLQMTSADVRSWYNNREGTMLFNSGSVDSANNSTTISFGGFILNTAQGELRNSGNQSIIRAIPFTSYSSRRYVFGLQSDNHVVAVSQGSETPQLFSPYQNANTSPAGTAFAINTPGANESGYFRRITYWPARLPTPIISSIAWLAT